MPKAAPKPCTRAGCGVIVRDGSSRCEAHKVIEGSFADRRRGTRQQRGYGQAWERVRAQVLVRDGGLCQVCADAGRITPNCNEVDHIVNKAAGGTDDLDNLQTICKPCHRAKTTAERLGQGAGGVQKSAPADPRTDTCLAFSRAQVLGGGG